MKTCNSSSGFLFSTIAVTTAAVTVAVGQLRTDQTTLNMHKLDSADTPT
jgi:hypothetical protein